MNPDVDLQTEAPLVPTPPASTDQTPNAEGNQLADLEAAPGPTFGTAVPDWAPKVEASQADPWALPDPDADPFDTPAASPDLYELPPLTDGEVTDESLATARGLRNLMFGARFTPAEGAAFSEMLVDASARFGDMDDVSFTLAADQTAKQLREMMGDSDYESSLKALNGIFADLNTQTSGKLDEFLDDKAHLLTDPLVMYRLLAAAARYEHRGRK